MTPAELDKLAMVRFEGWLRTVCYQKPTPEAYDLAKEAWRAAIDQALAIQRGEVIEECAKVVEETVDVDNPPWHAKKEWRYPFHREIATAIRALNENCEHEWVSAVNKVIQNGEICIKCRALKG